MKIQIKIEHQDNGSMTVTTTPADLMRWERMTKTKMTDLFEIRRVDGQEEVKVNIGFEDLMIMAWSVLYRTQETTAKFDDWANRLDEIEMAGVDEPNPPQTEASAEPSQL